MKGYLFISNGTKPTEEQYASMEAIAIGSFSFAAMSAAKDLGYRLYAGVNRKYPDQVACTNFDVTFYDQHIYRSIFALRDNYRAYKNCCNFLKAHPDIKVIHCNTPIGGVIGRLCGWKFHKKVVYTAHGFHFYKGAPLINWMLFYPIEKMLARITDAIITINHEDYELASKRFKLRNGGKVYYVPGVGIDLKQYENVPSDRNEKRKNLGLADEVILAIIVGDLNKNKNVGTLIRALPKVNSDVHYFICGQGPLADCLRKMVKDLSVENKVHFLGFRRDIKELYKISDFFLMASRREGLPRSTMEAMTLGLPCIVSQIRGNMDLIDDGYGGILVHPNDYERFAKAIDRFCADTELRAQCSAYNQHKIQQFAIENIIISILKIYEDL